MFALEELGRLAGADFQWHDEGFKNDDPRYDVSYTYDPNGNLQTTTYANGLSHNYSYDVLNRLTSLQILNHQSEILDAFNYELNALGHRTEVAEHSGRLVTYTYDNLHRLTRESINLDPDLVNGSTSYTYDQVGNRLNRASTLDGVGPQAFSYSDNDWLDGDTYDANGNTLLSDVLNLESEILSDEYDYRNRLIRRTYADARTIDVAPGDGTPAKATHYLLDTNSLTGYAQVVEELKEDGAGGLEVSVSYAYGHDLISQDRYDESSATWQISYYLYDGHGSVIALADTTGSLTDEYRYDAFGNLLVQSGVTRNSYLYTGEQYDADLGLYYLRARYLNPASGRFWTMDRFEGFPADPISLHKYLYAHGNPVMGLDPSGEFTMVEIANVAKIVGITTSVAVVSSYVIKNRSDFVNLEREIYVLITKIVTDVFLNHLDKKQDRSGSGKNEPHGSGEESVEKYRKQIKELESKIEELKKGPPEPGRGKKIEKLKTKIKNVRKILDKKLKGETHHTKGRGR